MLSESPPCAATSRGPGYDDLTLDEVRAERAHKNRAGVLTAVARDLATA